jgi:hypothetical protein
MLVAPFRDLQEGVGQKKDAGLKTGHYNVSNGRRTRYHLGRYDYAEIHD